MKNTTNKLTPILVLFAFYFSLSTLWAQAPQSFEYQAVVRNASGNILVSQAVGVQITIKQGGASGTNVYQETFATITNLYGLVNLQIGTGVTSGNFSTIDWANNTYFIEVALDVTGGTSYTIMGTSQLISVPYALHAKTVEINDACNLFSYYYADRDGDGYGDAFNLVFSCSQPTGFVTNNTDCNDNNATTYPGAIDICDGIDNDCDGTIDEGFDVDLDGYTTCAGDCDDMDPTINPGVSEICDGIDNNCNGAIDDGFDMDGDGYTTCNGDCDDMMPDINPGEPELCGDGVDNNCNGQIDEGFDFDLDGYTDCQGDCNDFDPTIYPGAPEICDGMDNNCNGQIDEGVLITFYEDADHDTYGNPYRTIQACSLPAGGGYVANNGDCDDHLASTNPGATEICGDGIDNDCDGTIDEGCGCINGTTRVCSNSNAYGTCIGQEICINGVWSACDASIPSAEVCNGMDDDCDGQIDEGFDNDLDGFTTCTGDCDDNVASTNPGATEICGDGIDNDCDGATDEGCCPPVGSACDDGDACTVSDTEDGNCNCIGVPVDCNDGNPNTIDACNPAVGCTHTLIVLDTDLDGVPDASDNCPNTYNPSQIDTDGDGKGDVCDCNVYLFFKDADGDGYGNPLIHIVLQSNTGQAGYVSAGLRDCDDTNPLIHPNATEIMGNGKDEDCDGVIDSQASTVDSDGDGLSNVLEATLGTNSLSADSDGDGISDFTEYIHSLAFGNDFDGDGLPNYLDNDSDNDGKSDFIDGVTDNDCDGIPNYLDINN